MHVLTSSAMLLLLQLLAAAHAGITTLPHWQQPKPDSLMHNAFWCDIL